MMPTSLILFVIFLYFLFVIFHEGLHELTLNNAVGIQLGGA